MTALFYDNVTTGHHQGYMNGIVQAAEATSTKPLVATPIRPPALRDAHRWIPVDEHQRRSVILNRRTLGGAVREATALGADTLFDLYLDHQIWTTNVQPRLERTVHVLHHAEQYQLDRSHKWWDFGPLYLRRRLREECSRGATVVVHTRRSRDLLQEFLPKRHVVVLGYPVDPIPPVRESEPSDRPSLLFVGSARHEKGLEVLLAALTASELEISLRIIGRQSSAIRAAITTDFPTIDITWMDNFVDDETLRHEYSSADLAVLPYRSHFGEHGGPSSVLLETLSAGLPIVTTSALEDQLPPLYEGAVVAISDSVDSMSAALDHALSRLPALMRAARDEGPAFVANNHTYAAYLTGLEEAASTVY